MRRLGNRGPWIAWLSLSVVLTLSCSAGESGNRGSCVAGAPISCACGDGRTLTTMCLADSSGYAACPCTASGTAGTQLASPPGGAGGMSSPQATGAGGAPPIAGMGGGGTTGTAGRAAGMAGMFGSAGAAGKAGSAASTAGTSASAGTTGAGGSSNGVPTDELEMLRQVCVDEINMYRAMLSLKPLMRASAAQEACSDKGAQMDGDSGMAHMSARAGLCRSVGLGAEDTCPGWPVGGGFGSNATIADALKGCLKSMWAEGMPPVSRDACIMDSSGCFQMYGHYLNMSDPNAGAVACSFYKMKDGTKYWMNQDFAY